MKPNRCPFCNSKATIYPFICQVNLIYEPKFLFKDYYLVKAHSKDIPIYWTVECSKFCKEWDNEYNNKDSLIAKENKEEAIEKWNKWVGDIENDNPCRH